MTEAKAMSAAEKQQLLKELAPKTSFGADGRLIFQKREVQAKAPVAIEEQASVVNDMGAAVKALEVGDKIADGTVYAGELNGKKIFAAPEDVKGTDHCNLAMNFNAAVKYAEELNENNYLGHNDWHVPDKDELNV